MPQLPKDLRDKYELKNWPGRGTRQIFGPKFRVVDLEKITEAKAERLIQMGFPYLQRVTKKKADVSKADDSAKKDSK
jgi:hypothetical protein